MKKIIAILLTLAFSFAMFGLESKKLYEQGLSALEMGDLETAEIIFKTLLSKEPDNPEYRKALAKIYKFMGKFEEAIREYKKVLALKGGKDTDTMINIATVYRWMRQYQLSKKWLQHVLSIDPANREAREDLENLRLRRGLHLFFNYGATEVDYTNKVYEGKIFVGVIDEADIYAGYSKSERIFYSRKKTFGRVYWFPRYTTYLKIEFYSKDYDYPNLPNFAPDSNCYDKVPGFEVEISHSLGRNYRVSLFTEFFSPNFYWDPATKANNLKVGGQIEVEWLNFLNTTLFLHLLRDPNPETFQVDKIKGKVLNLDYQMQYLIGGGIDLDYYPIELSFKYIPNRDLDRSLESSYFFTAAVTAEIKNYPVKFRVDFLHDKYSRYSYLSGQTSRVIMLSLLTQPFKNVDLQIGVKNLRRPGVSDNVFFVGGIYRIKL